MDADLPSAPTFKAWATKLTYLYLAHRLRAVVEAHGDIFTVPSAWPRATSPARRALWNAPHVVPDGQSIAYFSDESGYMRCMSRRKQARRSRCCGNQKNSLASEPAYYFDPKWSPIPSASLHDNRLHIYMLEVAPANSQPSSIRTNTADSPTRTTISTGRPIEVIAYPRSLANHLHALYLYSIDSGQSTQ